MTGRNSVRTDRKLGFYHLNVYKLYAKESAFSIKHILYGGVGASKDIDI